MRTFNEWAWEVHENAVKHGWWDEERSFPEIIALIHSELSEALEEYRNGRPNLYFPCNAGGLCVDDEPDKNISCGSRIYNPDNPEAPCSIRILDWCGKEGIDIDRIISTKHEYNKTRPYRHGGKRL